MRKIFVLLVTTCLLVFSSVSCSKTCTCKDWALGVAGDEYEIELNDSYKTCSEMSVVVDNNGVKTGMECR